MMDDAIVELMDWLHKVDEFDLPTYKELPSVPLYMEQVITYVNGVLTPLSEKEKNVLTSFMVNNYVKAKIINEPINKKYTKDQLGYLIAISILKQTLSISETSLLIELDGDLSQTRPVLYEFFRLMVHDIVKDETKRMVARAEKYTKEYYKEREEGSDESAEKHLRDNLGLIALRLSIKAAVEKAIAEALLRAAGASLHGELYDEAISPTHKQAHRAKKNSVDEAEKLAKSKKKSQEKREKSKLDLGKGVK